MHSHIDITHVKRGNNYSLNRINFTCKQFEFFPFPTPFDVIFRRQRVHNLSSRHNITFLDLNRSRKINVNSTSSPNAYIMIDSQNGRI